MAVNVNDGHDALNSGRLDQAQAIFLQLYDQDPGEASLGLGWVAIARQDYSRAENLGRAAVDNNRPEGLVILAEAIGAQGRRGEAEQVAQAALDLLPDHAYLRAVLAEQHIRQAEWEAGAQRLMEAVALDRAGETHAFLRRLFTDLTRAHAVGKIPTDVARGFIEGLQYNVSGEDYVAHLLNATKQAVEARVVLDAAQSSQPPRRATAVARAQRAATEPPGPPPPSAPAGASRPVASVHVPALVAVMQRDRKLNEELQALVAPIGLPVWPSKIGQKLDVLPPIRPQTLGYDPERMKQNTLALTSGEVATEILLERAQQALMRAAQYGSATVPGLDEIGLTQLEIAMWDGALERMRSIPEIYRQDKRIDAKLLALGAFLGDCVVRNGDATWSFANQPEKSTVTIAGQTASPFKYAAEWILADDKDDVYLEEVLATARALEGYSYQPPPRIDPTEGIQGEALALKLAEQWFTFRGHAPGVALADIAGGIRPLKSLKAVVFFALRSDLAPPAARGVGDAALSAGEVPIAYVRRTGEFLCLGSRKHYARAMGAHLGVLTDQTAPHALEIFKSLHRPGAKIAQTPTVRKRADAAVLPFVVDGTNYELWWNPQDPVAWRLNVE